MVEDSRSDDSDFCHELLSKYGLTPDQMHRAAARYRLGRSKSGKTIFWMIDDLGICRDGHIATSWVSAMLKSRYPDLAQYVCPHHCLFGLHLIPHCASRKEPHPDPLMGRGYLSVRATGGAVKPPTMWGEVWRGVGTPLRQEGAGCCERMMPLGIIESERSAVILSEACPDLLWLAYAYPANLTVDQFAPLQGRTVTLFPRADPDEYLAALELADQVRRAYPIDISVSALLEDHATDSQKSRNIDLVDFLFNL